MKANLSPEFVALVEEILCEEPERADGEAVGPTVGSRK
jgi:hypothetical protein